MTGRRVRYAAALACAALALSACTSNGNGSPTVPVVGGSVASVAPAAQVSIAGGGSTDFNPRTPIVVAVTDGRLTSVTVTNAVKGNTVTGTLSADGSSWTSAEELGYGSTYTVVADAVGVDGKPTEQKGTVKTVTPAAQAYPALTPAPPAAGVTFGVGQIIGVSFDHNITDRAAVEKALTVRTNPPQPGGWYWIDAKTLHYRPPVYWRAGTTITLEANLYGVDLGGGVYGQTDRSATYQIHDSWVAKADGNSEQMQIVHNGVVTATMPISIGKDATPTHAGPHVITDKQQQVVMDSCTYGVCPPAPGAYRSTEYWAERISNDGEFVHENPNMVGEQGSSNVSHGCINLSPQNAQAFFAQFGLGDVVEVTNTPGPPLPVWDAYGDWELSWADWQAGSALH
ncbi:Ig-like domain-containing protein [Amycolatopsis acidiphila]|uniref:L,D-transpeptidase family protein n=1 Tax=Amycolatopsis acidiphila TaxID=715473 RepID=A0A558AJA6_9PSEU|nr:L,D-transpeptidase family protein [Amycolatopsis acidiphila]UIJ62644.1 Ig-like domain-containing protein [Amycolatopsis acidiphila]